MRIHTPTVISPKPTLFHIYMQKNVLLWNNINCVLHFACQSRIKVFRCKMQGRKSDRLQTGNLYARSIAIQQSQPTNIRLITRFLRTYIFIILIFDFIIITTYKRTGTAVNINYRMADSVLFAFRSAAVPGVWFRSGQYFRLLQANHHYVSDIP